MIDDIAHCVVSQTGYTKSHITYQAVRTPWNYRVHRSTLCTLRLRSHLPLRGISQLSPKLALGDKTPNPKLQGVPKRRYDHAPSTTDLCHHTLRKVCHRWLEDRGLPTIIRSYAAYSEVRCTDVRWMAELFVCRYSARNLLQEGFGGTIWVQPGNWELSSDGTDEDELHWPPCETQFWKKGTSEQPREDGVEVQLGE